jgi:HAD superfamily hydrolase (TIGR01549 family)
MPRVRAVFYDLDNTLYPQINDVEQRIDYCIGAHSLPPQIKSFWVREWLDNGPLKPHLLDHVMERFHLGIDKKELLRAYRTYRTELCLDPEVRDCLMTVKRRGIKQFIITNGTLETQSKKIDSLNLRELMEDIIIATGEHAKPSAHWFSHVVANHRLSPKECLSLGDWYSVDGVASLSAGICFLHVRGGPIVESIPPDINSITRIPEMESYLKEDAPNSRELR